MTTRARSLSAAQFNDDELDRLMARTRRRSSCRLWTGAAIDGSPTITRDKEQYLVRRVVWAITRGECPAGVRIGTTCEGSLCINPEHLARYEGEVVPCQPTRIDKETAARIRRMWRTQAIPMIAEQTGLTADYIGRVVHDEIKSLHDDTFDPKDRAEHREQWVRRLTAEDVVDARAAVRGGASINSQAKRFGVAFSSMHAAVTGASFKWLGPGVPADRRQPVGRPRR